MSSLKKVSMKDQIYQLIKERIFNQTYKLGEKINMLELSQELGVSNSPIREALSLLESEGLVVFVPNAGPSVIRIDEDLFAEVQETAKVLLLGCYDQCVEKNLIPQLVRACEEPLQRQKELQDDISGETDVEFAQLSLQFDIAVVKVLRNKTLEKLYAAFFNLLFLVILYEHQNLPFSRHLYVEEHEKIKNAVEDGDGQEVRRLIGLHFRKAFAVK